MQPRNLYMRAGLSSIRIDADVFQPWRAIDDSHDILIKSYVLHGKGNGRSGFASCVEHRRIDVRDIPGHVLQLEFDIGGPTALGSAEADGVRRAHREIRNRDRGINQLHRNDGL